MMEILACPIDKNHPLELFEINQKKAKIGKQIFGERIISAILGTSEF